jgi:hypothetical protein
MIVGLVICLTIPACRTSEQKVSDADGLSPSSDAACEVTQRLKRITIPDMTFYPPATIVDTIDFLKQASIDYDDPSIPLDQRGVSFILRLNQDPSPVAVTNESVDVFASAATASRDLPRIAAMSVQFISMYDALNLVCEVTDMKWEVSRERILLTPKEQDGVCVSRSYTVPQALSDKLFHKRHGPASNVAPNTVWEAFFKELGVTGPTNATVEYLPFAKRLDVTNTRENLELVEKVFNHFAMRTVEVEMEIHAFSTSDIERLHLSGGMSLESLMKLRESGKSKSVATASVLTKSGQEAIMRAVQEVIYPTELMMDSSQTGSNRSERIAIKALKPSNFATRETGMILQVVPEVFEEERSKINLTLKPQWITLEGWTTFPASWSAGGGIKSSTFKQPIFGVTSFETQAVLTDGETIMLGSCSTPDCEWVHVGFLTARLQDVESGPWGSRREKTNSRNELKNAAVAEKLKSVFSPEMSSRLPPSTTIIDVVRSLKDASIQYDSGVPEMERGINFVLKVPASFWEQKQTQSLTNVDIFAEPESGTNGVPYIPSTVCRRNTLYDTLKLACDITGMEFEIKDGIVWIEPSSVYKENYKWWIYPLLTSSCEIISPDSCSQTNDFSEQKYISFFEKLGVQWPMDSRVRYLPSVDMICFKMSRSGMDSIKKVLDDDLGCKPLCLEVDVQIHAFPAEEIDRLRRASDITVKTLMDLRRVGKSKQVASATVLTKSGHEAIMKSVREILYPADLMTDVNSSNSNITVQTSAHALVPSEFVMRETGMILQVVPEMSDRGQSQISVLVKPTWVTLDRWEPYSADLAEGLNHSMIPFKQPVFGMKSFETQTTVKDGETVLLGSSATTDNKSVQFGFLTVRRKQHYPSR